MILTVTCNPALDVTYTVGSLQPGAVHRVREVTQHPGGKGVNVTRVLHQLGEPVCALGVADAGFEARLGALGVPATFVDAMPEVRRTVVIHGVDTTSLWEPGPAVGPDTEDRLIDLVSRHVGSAHTLVVSGSLPPGVPAEVPSGIAALAGNAGVPVVLDLDDEALAVAALRGGAVLTPNTDEIVRLLGDVADPVLAVHRLARQTGAPVVLTRGDRGVLASDGERCWQAFLPDAVAGNPTGAGDATTAGVARGLAHGQEWPEILRHAVALGAAAVAVPYAGKIDSAAYESHLSQVRVETADPTTIGR